ncbi:MAG: hypothetical protein QXU95_03375 [Candidatus Bathyarchaeia archaeon]|nr:hypothetical protein [Candidatus Bathyarchaeota archaeon]
MILDKADPEIVALIVEEALKEKGRRLPIHSIHRWWSRRFAAIYRFILAGYLLSERSAIKQALENPSLLRRFARGKTFVEPFAGGGTGLTEAAFAGWKVYGMDVNPLAVRISEASVKLVTSGLPKDYEQLATKVLDEAFEETRFLWMFEDKLVSYFFISRGDVPTWISNINIRNKQYMVLMCPRCFKIFTTNWNNTQKVSTCPFCKDRFKISMKGKAKLNDSYPETTQGWKVYAVELRDPSNEWRKLYINIKENKALLTWFKKSTESAVKIAKEAKDILEEEIKVLEGKRLLREADIRYYYQLFTPRQLASFTVFSHKAKEFAKSSQELTFLSLAISETTKTSCIATKWHPPISEPVPAAAMKTYWVPEYTVETNPLAHIPGTLRPLARNTIASAIRAQKNADRYISERGITHDLNAKVINNRAELARFPPRIDLAVIDPPYMDSVKSYASLSLVHYAGIKLFDYIAKVKIPLAKLEIVEKRELPRDPEKYETSLSRILEKISYHINFKSRVVLMYNRLESKDWIPPLRAAKNAGLLPIAIYWVLGESPGKLARSALRGIFLIVMRSNTIKKRSEIVKVHKVFEKVIDGLSFIDVDKERQAFGSLLEALNEVYL